MLKDIVMKPLVTCEPDAKVEAVARLMNEKNVGCVMVLDNEKPRGLITDRDIVIRCIAKNVDVADCTVEQVMSESLEHAKDTDGISDVIQKMHDNRVRRMPVVDSRGHAIGLVSFGDMIALLAREFYALTSSTRPPEEQSKIIDFDFEDSEYTDEMAA